MGFRGVALDRRTCSNILVKVFVDGKTYKHAAECAGRVGKSTHPCARGGGAAAFCAARVPASFRALPLTDRPGPFALTRSAAGCSEKTVGRVIRRFASGAWGEGSEADRYIRQAASPAASSPRLNPPTPSAIEPAAGGPLVAQGRRRTKSFKRTFTPERLDILERIVDWDETLYLDEIRRLFYEVTGRYVSISSVARACREIDLTRKKVGTRGWFARASMHACITIYVYPSMYISHSPVGLAAGILPLLHRSFFISPIDLCMHTPKRTL